MRRSERGLIGSWVVRIVLWLAIAGLTLFEAGAIIVAMVGVDGTADVAAREAALEYFRTKNEGDARARAEEAALQGDSVITSFVISADGGSVKVTLRRTAQTRIVHRIGPLKKFTTPSATAESAIR